MKCSKCDFENPENTSFCGNCAAPLTATDKAADTMTAATETPKEELKTGSTFAERYQIIEELGKGGMGKVYRALDTKLNEEVALKLVKPEIASDVKVLERFSNELKVARKIIHKNVGRMYELMEEKGTHFITMEYVPGQDLQGLIKQSGQLATGTVLSIARQICDGLSEAHQLGVIHRDLKPSNIMIDKEGHARIMDFGIARSLQAKPITGAGVMIGTPEYMSPEQVESKDMDQRSDIYSLGVILFEMITGQVPFEGDTPFSIGVKHKSEIPRAPKSLNDQITEPLNQLILKCLEKERAKRFNSVEELSSEISRIEEGRSTTPIAVKSHPNRKKILIPALVVIAMAVIAIVILQLIPQKQTVPPPAESPSIAVLPFEDLSPQKDQAHLCDGFAESIINALWKIRDLRVPASTSSFSFRGNEVNIQEIGEKLNVKTVFRGSVQKAENRVRITAQLINVADESLLWSNQYNRELHDIFTIQDELTMAIVDNLMVELLGEEKLEVIKRYTENPEAYNLYLQGRYQWNRRLPDSVKNSIDYFEKAIARDPNYALAYAGIADAYIILGEWGVIPPLEAYPRAKDSAFKALELDDKLAEAQCAMAMISRDFDWDWDGAEKRFKRAIELNPNYPTVHQWYAEYLTTQGRFDEALVEIKFAEELDPLSLIIKTILGMVYQNSRRYDLGIEQCQQVLEMNPSFPLAHYFLGLNYYGKGMYEEAIEAFHESLGFSGGNFLASHGALGFAYAMVGKKNEAQNILDDVLEKSKQGYVNPSIISFIYIGFGDYERALDYLERGFELKEFMLVFLKVMPFFDPLRPYPRFQAMLKKMNLD